MSSKAGTAEPIPASILKRRARNRASQKNFRDRHARYVKELEANVVGCSSGSADELAAAREDADRLRQTLAALKTRILSLRDDLSAVVEEIDLTLDSASPSHDGRAEASPTNPGPWVDNRAVVTGLDPGEREHPCTDVVHQQNGASTIQSQLQEVPQGTLDAAQAPAGQSTSLRAVAASSVCVDFSMQESNGAGIAGPAAAEAPHAGKNSYNGYGYSHWMSTPVIDAGTAAFPTLLPADTPEEQPGMATFVLPFPPEVIRFPSVFSAHIDIIQFFAKKSTAYACRSQIGGAEAFSKLVTTMVNMFVTTCWPDMCIWWTYIQSSKVVEKLMRWSLDSCVDNYRSLPVTHRPTALQVCTAHPAIIDWAFFPSVRDRMIELYSDSWLLDELVCELVHAYVVEADLSSLVTGLENSPPQKGYFRMWDIVQTISNDMQRRSPSAQRSSSSWNHQLGLNDDLFSEATDLFDLAYVDSEVPWTKMPLEKIYQSSQAAWKLFKLLRMEDRRAVKIDPGFAAAHPELCDDSSIVANGIDCTLRDNSTFVPRPKPLTREAIINYKMIICNS